MLEPDLIASLERALGRQGTSLFELRRKASAVVLFGSRAAGCATTASDWDVLCIGHGRPRKTRELDLVWVDRHAVDGAAWLGGDLAGHVAAHGLWLEGAPCWNLASVSFPAAAGAKERRLARVLGALARSWDLLGAAYRAKHATLVRRDVQRWQLLQRGAPVPPSAVLDDAWTTESGNGLVDTLVAMDLDPDLAQSVAAAGVRGRGQEPGRSPKGAAPGAAR